MQGSWQGVGPRCRQHCSVPCYRAFAQAACAIRSRYRQRQHETCQLHPGCRLESRLLTREATGRFSLRCLAEAPGSLPFCHSFRKVKRCWQAHSLQLDIPTPEIGEDLRYYQEEAGAEFTEQGVPLSFSSGADALQALRGGAVLVDRSHCGRLRIGGQDALKFLHGQSTNDLIQLQPGQGCTTVFVTAQARTIELATCHVLQQGNIMVTVSADVTSVLLDRLNKYIFPGDQVTVRDVSSDCCMLVLAGPGSKDVLKALGAPQKLLEGAPASHGLLEVGSRPVLLANGSGLHHPGYTLIADEGNAGELWRALTEKGAVPMGEAAWERERIISGRPRAGRELTDAHTPLEAGLWDAVSLDKGCYIGQETLAKVSKLGALNRELWGLQLQAAAQPGTTVYAGDKNIGEVTSCAQIPDGTWFALAYLRCKSRGQHQALEGIQVTVQEAPATVVAIPFASRSFPDDATAKAHEPLAIPKKVDQTPSTSQGPAAAPTGSKAPDEAQQQRLKAMQDRLKAWQEQQQQQTK